MAEMTAEEAARLFRLAWFHETQVPKKNLDQRTYRSIAPGETEASLMLWECRSTCCSLGWTAYLWPEHWEWCAGFPLLRKISCLRPFYDACVFFGISVDESREAFGAYPRIPFTQARLLRSFAKNRGWVEQEDGTAVKAASKRDKEQA